MMPAPARIQVCPSRSYSDRNASAASMAPSAESVTTAPEYNPRGLSSKRRIASTLSAFGMPVAVTAGKSRLERIHPVRLRVQPTLDRRPEVLHTAPLTHGHEVGDHCGAWFGHLGDLLQRTAHRDRMLHDLLGVRLEVVAGGPVVVRTASEWPGARQRLGHHRAIARSPRRRVRG